MCPWSQEALPIYLSDGFGEGKQDVCVCVSLPSPVPGSVSPTWIGHPACSKDPRESRRWSLSCRRPGCVHAAARRGPTAQAAGGTLEGLHAAVPLDVQVLKPPALPALPKFQLDLPWEKEGKKSHPANQLLTKWPHCYISGEGKKSTALY